MAVMSRQCQLAAVADISMINFSGKKPPLFLFEFKRSFFLIYLKPEQHQVPLPQANNTTVLMDNLTKRILTIMLLSRLRRHLIEK
jgi:hypothetical protein